MKKKRIPMRKCVECNENRPKKELIRMVKNKEGILDVDLTGKMNGRGAYICPKMECLDKVKKSKRLSKALEVEITDDIYDKLYSIIESKQ